MKAAVRLKEYAGWPSGYTICTAPWLIRDKFEEGLTMRGLCFLFLLVFLGAAGGFAYFNQDEITLRFLDWSTRGTVAMVVGAAYLLGMLSGWTVVGMLRRSLYRVTQGPIVREQVVRR
jgi:hypothetical protein